MDLQDIPIKIDTGAYTSSIHCHHIHVVETEGIAHIEFELLDPSHSLYQGRVFKTKNFNKKDVKSSFGKVEQRFFVKTNIGLFNKVFEIELSLSERSEMKFPILIGRKFLKNKFMVDPSIKDVWDKQKRSTK